MAEQKEIKSFENNSEVSEILETDSEKHKIKTYTSFDDMGLKPDVLKGVYSYGFEKPSAIQQKAIVPLAKGYDIIAQAQSGTGKTGTFTIGVLQRIDCDDNFTQALILSPTIELASQTHTVITNLSSKVKDLRIQLSIGGTKTSDYNRWEKQKESHIIIGTPGRVLDNIRRKKIYIDKLKMFILDEADEMLSRGFIDQIYDVFQYISPDTQVALISATMPTEILDLSKKFLRDPVHILIKREELTLEGIKQFYVALEKKSHKIDTLIDLFETISVTQSIIFINKKREVEEVYDILTNQGFGVGLITGNMSQEQRNNVIKNFRNGNTRVLLTTGLLARGFDMQQVSLVINYDLPREKDSYCHCAGRCGRMGKKGCVINLVTKQEYQYLREIEKYYETQIEELPMNIGDYI